MITMVSSNTSDIESLGRERRGKELKKLWTAVGNNSMLLGLTLFATTLLCVTTAFSQATFSSTSIGEIWHISFTWTLAALRVLQAVTTSTTTYTLSLAFESIQWTLVEKKPCSLFTALMLTESTGFMGLLQLGFNRASTWDQRVWPCIRFVFLLFISLASIALFINTSFGPVYNATFAFNVTAGTGKFDGSFVAPTMKAYNGNVTLWTLATASTFLKTSQYSTSIDPINCAEENSKCESYLLPGGVRSILPNPPVSNLDPIVLVHDSPASQVEFAIDLKGRDQFSSEECIVYGDKKYLVGVEFCLAHNSALPGSIVAGIFVCSKGTENETCNHDLDRPRLNITTTMSTFSRRASTISARSDNSIIAISNLSPAIPSPLDDTQALHAAMGWLLNYTAASLPPRSSLAYFFWSSQGMSKHDWSVDAYKTLNSLLAFTSWFFTENNYGNPQFDPAKQTDQGIPFLSHEFYTTASTAKQYTKFTIDTRMFVVYIVLQVIPLLFCWAVLIWRMVRGSPQIDTSSFPLLDFYYKAKLEDNENIDCQDLLKADNSIFLKTLKNVNVVQRRICDIPSEESSSFLKE